ncbi:hypothetical protein FKP32DRAFT_121968 [Trametes sanguinea]|nr:hypothetical protein FKP32DRAFT_121968 [Trametes sanguinea]
MFLHGVVLTVLGRESRCTALGSRSSLAASYRLVDRTLGNWLFASTFANSDRRFLGPVPSMYDWSECVMICNLYSVHARHLGRSRPSPSHCSIPVAHQRYIRYNFCGSPIPISCRWYPFEASPGAHSHAEFQYQIMRRAAASCPSRFSVHQLRADWNAFLLLYIFHHQVLSGIYFYSVGRRSSNLQ